MEQKKINFKIGSGVNFLLFSLSICNFEIKEVILDFKLAFEIIQFEAFELKIMRNKKKKTFCIYERYSKDDHYAFLVRAIC